jgi:hypothetical protein
MTLNVPDFKLDKPNPNGDIPNAIWWFMLRLEELEPKSQNGGILAFKPSFHAPGDWIKRNYPNHYSIRDAVNQSGEGWTKASAWDWTFPDAQRGDYRTIAKYTKRLWNSAHDPKDPRLDLWLFEFYGQTDSDKHVEGYNEHREDDVTADDSHLWHLHGSTKRKLAGSFWGAWATLTVLMVWSVEQWRKSLTTNDPNSDDKQTQPKPTPRPGLKHYDLGSRELNEGDSPGTDVAYVQRFAGGSKYFGPDDGIPGPKFTAGVKRYQRILGFKGKDVDGIVGDKTWAKMGIK